VSNHEGAALTPTVCRNAGADVVLDAVQLVSALAVTASEALAVKAKRDASTPRVTVVGTFEGT
jgi:hypothetical protein